MSNRPAFVFWICVNIKGKRRFRLSMPIPLYIALAFADMFEDLCLTDMRLVHAVRSKRVLAANNPSAQ